jgi:ABC-type dipeptide/oligopeptide/nickel transport system ATPase component
LVLGMTILHNGSMAVLPRLSKLGWLNRTAESRTVREFTDRLRVKAPSIESLVGGLSGGNQQKVVLAKWLATDAAVLLIDEPTRGVDVGAKVEIHGLIREAAASGKAVLLVSSDMPELRALCDRMIVLREGVQVAELGRAASETEILSAMAGV